jgi:uncharacterized protein YgbK (DUF1537 family)
VRPRAWTLERVRAALVAAVAALVFTIAALAYLVSFEAIRAFAVQTAAFPPALAWAAPLLRRGPVLVYSTASPERVRAVQERLGRERSGELVEQALAAIARGLVDRGVGQLIVAGGETSGAVVSALGVKGLRIGPQIAPGVPWTSTLGGRSLALALKSGNFGARDFFLDAWNKLP